MSEIFGPPLPEASHDRSTLKRDLIWAITAIVAIATVASLSFINWYRVAAANARAMETRLVLGQLRTILRLLDEAETGQRGFLLTGRDEYLVPYTKAVRQIPKTLVALQRSAELRPYPNDVAAVVAATRARPL